MILFLTTFFLIYGAMHVYAFLKAKAAFAFDVRGSLLLALLMAAMTLAPLVIRLLERRGYESSARFLSYVGYSWMAILLFFVAIAIALDIYRFAVYGTGFILQKDLVPFLPSPRLGFMLSLLLALSIAVYGYFEAKDVRVERIVIRSAKIARSPGKLTIAQISDVHLGLIVREERLKKILEEVKKAQPDILISTGDLVDGQINNLSASAAVLKTIRPPLGKFAVTGNHEFYAGLPQALAFMDEAGFTVLRGEGLTVAGLINLVGIDDPTGRASGLSREVSETSLLSNLPREKFTLLIKHLPSVDERSLGLFDLQISGHTHKGQIFPFRYATRLFFHYDTGWFGLPHNSRLYVSRGAGTWGPPIRFLAPPEVTVFELIHGE